MYHEVGIQKLSDNQLSKLRNGHPVRVKVGNHHKICLSVQQLKKLHKAHQKGSASTVSFDPYQLDAHGSGILGDIGKKAKAFVQKYKLQDIVNPIINRVKNESHKGVSKLSNFAHSKINTLQPIEQGEGIISDVLGTLGNLSKNAGMGIAKRVGRKSAKSIEQGEGIISDVLGVIGNVSKVAGFGVGEGVARHHYTPTHKTKYHPKPPAPKKRRGRGIMTDLAKSVAKSVATKGVELGSNFLTNKIAGMGVAKHRRIVGRKPATKKSHGETGGALYPAGYTGGRCGGSMYPA